MSWWTLIEYGRARERRSAVHRVHGRRRRHALVARPRGLAARDPRRVSRRATARSTPIDEPGVGAGRSLRARRTAPTFGIISSTTDAVLPQLRPQPADGRRHVVPVPLRGARHRPARGRCARGATPDELKALIEAGWAREPTAAPRSGSRSAIGARSSRSARSKRPAPGDAHARRIAAPDERLRRGLFRLGEMAKQQQSTACRNPRTVNGFSRKASPSQSVTFSMNNRSA